MDKIQRTMKQLQTNLSELQYGLHLKEHPITNIHKSIECELIWKRSRTDEIQTSTTAEINDDDTGVESVNQDEGEDIHDYSTTNSTSTLSPTSYEHCLLSFLVGNDSLTSSTMNKDDKVNLADMKKILFNKKKSPTTILNSNKKKRRFCDNCGKS